MKEWTLNLWIRLAHEERGASLVEYALLITMIAIVAVAAVRFFGQNTNEHFEKIGSSF